MRRDVQDVMLTVVGGLSVQLGATDAHLAYVKPAFGPVLVIAGALIAAVGLVGILRPDEPAPVVPSAHEARVPTDDDHAQSSVAGDEHESGADDHSPPRAAWLLLLPCVALLGIAPGALGANAAAKDSGIPTAVDSGFGGLAVGGAPVELSVKDFALRALYDPGKSLQGVPVRLTGFVVPSGDGGWYVARFSINCCAADGRAVKVLVEGAGEAPPTDSWVTVEGTWVPVDPPSDPTVVPPPPRLRATSVERVQQPTETYE